jgi:hypothetical protein
MMPKFGGKYQFSNRPRADMRRTHNTTVIANKDIANPQSKTMASMVDSIRKNHKIYVGARVTLAYLEEVMLSNDYWNVEMQIGDIGVVTNIFVAIDYDEKVPDLDNKIMFTVLNQRTSRYTSGQTTHNWSALSDDLQESTSSSDEISYHSARPYEVGNKNEEDSEILDNSLLYGALVSICIHVSLNLLCEHI